MKPEATGHLYHPDQHKKCRHCGIFNSSDVQTITEYAFIHLAIVGFVKNNEKSWEAVLHLRPDVN